MLHLTIGSKELNIKFGYEPTLKSRLLSRLANITLGMEDGNAEAIENMLLFVPEMLLIGLQAQHEEYRYNYDTKEGYEEKVNMAFELVEEYLSEVNNDAIELSNLLQEELMRNGFLKKMFETEAEKVSNKKRK